MVLPLRMTMMVAPGSSGLNRPMAKFSIAAAAVESSDGFAIGAASCAVAKTGNRVDNSKAMASAMLTIVERVDEGNMAALVLGKV
jgi:hypothetical protein